MFISFFHSKYVALTSFLKARQWFARSYKPWPNLHHRGLFFNLGHKGSIHGRAINQDNIGFKSPVKSFGTRSICYALYECLVAITTAFNICFILFCRGSFNCVTSNIADVSFKLRFLILVFKSLLYKLRKVIKWCDQFYSNYSIKLMHKSCS